MSSGTQRVLDDESAAAGARLGATLPAGDGGILGRLRERCGDVQVRSAEASTLASTTVPES